MSFVGSLAAIGTAIAEAAAAAGAAASATAGAVGGAIEGAAAGVGLGAGEAAAGTAAAEGATAGATAAGTAAEGAGLSAAGEAAAGTTAATAGEAAGAGAGAGTAATGEAAGAGAAATGEAAGAGSAGTGATGAAGGGATGEAAGGASSTLKDMGIGALKGAGTGAVLGGVKSAATGQDIGEGIGMGALTGAIGGAASAGLGSLAGSAAEGGTQGVGETTTVGQGATANAGEVSQGGLQSYAYPDASSSNYFQDQYIGGTGQVGNNAYSAPQVVNTASNIQSANAANTGQAGFEYNQAPKAEPTTVQQIGQVAKEYPGATAAGVGLLASTGIDSLSSSNYEEPNKKKITPSVPWKWTGPSSYSYSPSTYQPYVATPNVYTPRYAEGGITDLSSFNTNLQPNSPVSVRQTQMMARGGISSLGSYSDGGQLLKGPGGGLDDKIPASIGGEQPARLADGEFVVSSDVVSALGGGSTDEGAKKLYAMMDRVRKQAHGTKKQIRKVNNKALPA